MDVVLVFPPGWYYIAVPADLSLLVGGLRDLGYTAVGIDGSAKGRRALFGGQIGWDLLRDPTSYGDPARISQATHDLARHGQALSEGFDARITTRLLALQGHDSGDTVVLREVGLDTARNPMLPTLHALADQALAEEPRWVGLALVHPDQMPQVLALASLLRAREPGVRLLVFGTMEDVLGPLDFADDLALPGHDLFREVDAAVLGAPLPALHSLLKGTPLERAPGVVTAAGGHVHANLAPLTRPAFDWVQPEDHMVPQPIVDLRLGQGCTWGRCTFCAIHAHNRRSRYGDAGSVAEAMRTAKAALGTDYFRLRDDLLAPAQLVRLGDALRGLGARWTARTRFHEGLTLDTLLRARDGGLEELWLGLESAVPEVRESMDKGVEQSTIRANLRDLQHAGLRVRLLCMIGFPGETEAQGRATVDFLEQQLGRVHSVALTPFLLARRSAIGKDPAAWGVSLAPEPVPVARRLRWTHPVEQVPGMSRDRVAALLDEAQTRLGPRLAHQGPDPSHGWLLWSRALGGR